MKKCVSCRASIDKVVPFVVCCGGTGKCHSALVTGSITHVRPPTCTAPPSSAAPAATAGALMNNGARDMSNGGDVQKLQQQLQDIKEQVSIYCRNVNICHSGHSRQKALNITVSLQHAFLFLCPGRVFARSLSPLSPLSASH